MIPSEEEKDEYNALLGKLYDAHEAGAIFITYVSRDRFSYIYDNGVVERFFFFSGVLSCEKESKTIKELSELKQESLDLF